MSKIKKKEKKTDKKGRILEKGESQLSDGRYRYRYTDYAGDRQDFYSYRLVETDKTPKGKKDKQSVRSFKLEMTIAKKMGYDYNKGNASLNHVFDEYVDHQLATKQIQLSSYHNYKGAWKHIKKIKISHMPIQNLRKSHFELLAKELFDNGVGHGVIKLVGNKMKSVMGYACDEDYVSKDYSRSALHAYDVTLATREALTLEVQTAFVDFLSQLKGYECLYRAVAFILETGLRISEMAALTVHDTNLTERIIDIDKQYLRRPISKDNVKQVRMITHLKTPSSYRQIPLFNKAVEVLEEQINYLASIEKLDNFVLDHHIKGKICKNFLFLTSRGKLWDTGVFNYQIKNVIKLYNKQETVNAKNEGREPKLLPKITAHILRHTACTRLSEREMCPVVLKTLMGHKNIDTTVIYNHVDKNRMLKEMNRLENTNLSMAV